MIPKAAIGPYGWKSFVKSCDNRGFSDNASGKLYNVNSQARIHDVYINKHGARLRKSAAKLGDSSSLTYTNRQVIKGLIDKSELFLIMEKQTINGKVNIQNSNQNRVNPQ